MNRRVARVGEPLTLIKYIMGGPGSGGAAAEVYKVAIQLKRRF